MNTQRRRTPIGASGARELDESTGVIFSADTGEPIDVAQRCPRCREWITGCVWNGGRCSDCHEATLLPVEQWGWDGTPWDSDDPTATPYSHPA